MIDASAHAIGANPETSTTAVRRVSFLSASETGSLETAKALVKSLRHGIEFHEKDDHSDLQNSDVDAMVSLFLPEEIETVVEETNVLWAAFLSSCNAIEVAEMGEAKRNAFKAMDVAFEALTEKSTSLRRSLRQEARSR